MTTDNPLDELIPGSLEFWRNQNFDAISHKISMNQREWEKISESFSDMVEIYLTLFNKTFNRGKSWKRCLIFISGLIAVLNGFIVHFSESGKIGGISSDCFTMLAWFVFIVSGISVVLNNIEKFENCLKQSVRARVMKDKYYSAYNEALYLWLNYVSSFGVTPEACVNSEKILHWIIKKDEELRNYALETMKDLEEHEGPKS